MLFLKTLFSGVPQSRGTLSPDHGGEGRVRGSVPTGWARIAAGGSSLGAPLTPTLSRRERGKAASIPILAVNLLRKDT